MLRVVRLAEVQFFRASVMATCDSLEVILCHVFGDVVVATDVQPIHYEFLVEGFLFFSAVGHLVQLLF